MLIFSIIITPAYIRNVLISNVTKLTPFLLSILITAKYLEKSSGFFHVLIYYIFVNQYPLGFSGLLIRIGLPEGVSLNILYASVKLI